MYEDRFIFNLMLSKTFCFVLAGEKGKVCQSVPVKKPKQLKASNEAITHTNKMAIIHTVSA